jgi:hypothetical protein
MPASSSTAGRIAIFLGAGYEFCQFPTDKTSSSLAELALQHWNSPLQQWNSQGQRSEVRELDKSWQVLAHCEWNCGRSGGRTPQLC